MYTPQTVIGYVHEKLPEFFDPGAELIAKELSDGNINFVFRVEDPATGKSLIINTRKIRSASILPVTSVLPEAALSAKC